jgi:glutathione S-transferase
MLTLYYAVNTCSLATHIALEDARAPYKLHAVDFAKSEQQSPDYLKINPKGRVPALVTPRGILTETPATLAFVAQSFPEAMLAPLNNAFEFAELQSFTSYLCSFTLPTRIAYVDIVGHMRPHHLPTCSARCPKRSVLALT